MKITKCDIWRVVVPIHPNTVNDPEYPDHSLNTCWELPKTILRAHTDNGLIGWGETNRGVPRESVDQLTEAMTGCDLLELDWSRLPIPHHEAHDAIEMLIFDLLGKSMGLRAAQLLGGPVREKVRCSYWTGMRTPENLARVAAVGKAKGFDGIKIKCTLEQPNVERFRAVADACGTDFKITVDPNQRFYIPAHAIELGRHAAEIGNVALFEDPIKRGNHLDWYVLLRQKMAVPVAMHLGTPGEILEAIRAGAIDYFNNGSSGMYEFVRCAYLGEIAGVPCWHGSGVDLGIREASFLHACAASPSCTLGSDIFGELIRSDDLIARPIEFENGHAKLPAGPGLGVEGDLDAIENHRVDY